jgi:hypothetical protein
MSLPPRSGSRRSPASRQQALRPTCPHPSASRSPHAIEAHQRRPGRATQTHARPQRPRLAASSRRGCMRERRLPGKTYPVHSASIAIGGRSALIRGHQGSSGVITPSQSGDQSALISRHQASSGVITPSQSGGRSALITVAIAVVNTVAISHALGPRSQSHAITCNHMQSATHLGHVASKVELGQRAAREPTDEAGTQARLSQLDDTCIGPKRRRERARISRIGPKRRCERARISRIGGRRGTVATARYGARARISRIGGRRGTVAAARYGARECDPARARVIQRATGALSNSEPERATVINGHQRSSAAIKGHQGPSRAIKGHQGPSTAVSGALSGGLEDSRQVLARLLYGRERVNRPARVHLLR